MKWTDPTTGYACRILDGEVYIILREGHPLVERNRGRALLLCEVYVQLGYFTEISPSFGAWFSIRTWGSVLPKRKAKALATMICKELFKEAFR